MAGEGKLMLGLLGVAVLGIPRAVVHSIKGRTKRFEIAGKVIEAPKGADRKYRRAFEEVGEYILHPLTRDVMETFHESSLTDQYDIVYRHREVPVATWYAVLRQFEQAGVIHKRWRLQLPGFGSDYKSVPTWKADGTRYGEAAATTIGDVVPDSQDYTPYQLTEEQKAELLGKPHKTHPNDSFLGARDGEPEEVIVTEEMFTPIYFRVREEIIKPGEDVAALRKFLGGN